MPLEYLNKDAMSRLPNAEYVYIIQDLDISGHVKIGRSKNPQQRFYDFGVKLPFEIGIIRVIPTLDSVKLEHELHDKYAKNRVKGEWFNLSDKQKLELLCMASDISFVPPERERFGISDGIGQFWKGVRRRVIVESLTTKHFVTIIQHADNTINIEWNGNHLNTWILGSFELAEETLPRTLEAAQMHIKMMNKATEIAKLWESEK